MFSFRRKTGILSCTLLCMLSVSVELCRAASVVASSAFAEEVWAWGHSESQVWMAFWVQVSRPELFLRYDATVNISVPCKIPAILKGVSCLQDLIGILSSSMPTQPLFPLYYSCIALKRKLRNITNVCVCVCVYNGRMTETTLVGYCPHLATFTSDCSHRLNHRRPHSYHLCNPVYCPKATLGLELHGFKHYTVYI